MRAINFVICLNALCVLLAICFSVEEGIEHKKAEELYEKQRQERIRRLNESTGISADIFKGTKEIVQETSHSPLASHSPSDKGVDISAIERLANGKWKQLI